MFGGFRERRFGKQHYRQQNIVEFMSDAAGKRTDRLQALPVTESAFEFVPMLLRGDFLAHFRLQALIDADQLVAHVFQIAAEIMKLQYVGLHTQALRIVAPRNLARGTLKLDDRPGQAVTPDHGCGQRDAQVSHQHPQRSTHGNLDLFKSGSLVKSEPQFRGVIRTRNRQRDEIYLTPARPEAEVLSTKPANAG